MNLKFNEPQNQIQENNEHKIIVNLFISSHYISKPHNNLQYLK